MAAVPLIIDNSHNNLITPGNHSFDKFFHSISNQGYTYQQTHSHNPYEEELFQHIRIFLIGVPQTSFFTQDEINLILEYVRKGGSLLIFHRYGGDLIQKTNLNELTAHFGIFFESTLVCSNKNIGVSSMPLINKFTQCSIIQNIKKIIIPGACSIRISKDAQMLCQTDEDGWVELYNPHSFKWIKDESGPSVLSAAYSIYGQGHVVVVGTPDFVNNNNYFGIDSLDNHRFLLNIMRWLTQPVSEMETRDWILQQLGTFSQEMIKTNHTITRIKEMLLNQDRRIRDLEMKVYELKGIHLPKKEE